MVKSFYSSGGLNPETYDARTFGFPGEIDFWIARAKESGGPQLDLLLERFTPQRQIAPYRNPQTGHTVSIDVVERTNDHVSQRLTERWRFRETSDDGRVLRDEEELLELRWTYRYEMRHLLELSNFVVEEELSDFSGAPPVYGLEQVVIARRK